MTWSEILFQLVLPPILGGSAGIISVWASWGIEKRRMLRTRRQELVDSWRNEIVEAIDKDGRLSIGKNPRYSFMRRPSYASLRPHLSPELLDDLEGARTVIVQGGDFPRRALMEEIGRIERKWGLV